jgi:nucleotide-binding universal stress UspA family protein
MLLKPEVRYLPIAPPRLTGKTSYDQGIVAEAEQGYDLVIMVIMGTSEQWFLQRWLFSGVSDRVAGDAPCSVLLVRQSAC